MNIEELKKQYFKLGNAIGELGAKLYELNGKIWKLVVKDNLGKEHADLLRKEASVQKVFDKLKIEFQRLEEIINN